MADSDCGDGFLKICQQFYRNGDCTNGNNCDYKHALKEQVVLNDTPCLNVEYVLGQFKKPADNENISDTSKGNSLSTIKDNTEAMIPPCKYFNKGNCHNGNKCRFLHNIIPTKVSVDENVEGLICNDVEENTPSSSSTLTAAAVNLHRIPSEDWVNAPEFIPKGCSTFKSYAQMVNPNANSGDLMRNETKLCPYAEADGICRYPTGECTYLHGDICELCGCAALHPFNTEQRKVHTQECIKQHERDMELSFAVARSKEKSCGVCFEVIMEKSAREQRFGILPNCNHCFCLTCIRKWRQARQFENKIIRACPECRVTSDFVCPSMYWVDTKEEKEKLIVDYKEALSKKDCKYFKQGRGKCPFGNKCFYLHALPDGTKADVGPPPRQQRRQNFEGGIDVLQQIILWDFLDERDNRWLYSLAEDIEDLVAFFSDSEDSDWSDYDLAFDD